MRTYWSTRGLLATCLLMAGCATMAGPGAEGGADVGKPASPPAEARKAEKPEVGLDKRLAAVSAGPRKRIAVAKFDAHGAFIAQYGGYDLGGGLAAQLATELVKTGRFIVVERPDLASALREQELGATRIVSKETAARLGQVTGAQFLVRGSLTEFESKSGGSGLRLGLGLPMIGGALGGATQTAHVGIDLRLIDTTTGQIVQATRAEAQARESGLTADVTTVVQGGKFDIGGDTFAKTPLGQATRQAISRAIDIIIANTEKLAWTGHVVDVNDDLVYINAGAESNLKAGDRFAIYRTTRQLTDPATGLVLGQLEDRLGEIVIENVQPKFSVARGLGEIKASRGDLVKLP